VPALSTFVADLACRGASAAVRDPRVCADHSPQVTAYLLPHQ
jgi:hypothetical protein